MLRARFYFAVISAASILSVAPLSAQSGTSVTGTVVDSKGEFVTHAKIAVHSPDNKITRSTVSDEAGRFLISNVPVGTYILDADAPGFATTHEASVTVDAGKVTTMNVTLRIGNLEQMVEVQADASNSIAAQQAPMDARLDARSARTEITSHFIENYTSPAADNTEMIFFAPGTFSVNSNGSGLGDSKSFFRGFSDGNYDITFDGIPYEDTNSPTHHSWAFFPAPFIGSIDFDRSPGTASTVGPTPFGGSINMLSKTLRQNPDIIGSVSYGTWNTILSDFQVNSGPLGANKKTHFLADFNHLTSDGFQTFNGQMRSAGDVKVEYRFNDEKILTGYSGVGMLDTNTPNIKGPTRAQYQAQYNYLLQNTDPTRADYSAYNYYHIPSDFEYVGFVMPLGKGWHLDTKQYTYSYYNQQNYASTPKTGVISAANCLPVGSQNCGTDKLNSYRKYGDITTVSQVSKYGIFRTGLWYEWATTSRHQIPQNPVTKADTVVPNFNEFFITNSYQPFAEYEWHPTLKLTVTGGAKFSRYTFDLKQLSDNGGAVGTLPAGQAAVYHYATFNTVLPSADVNYRFRENWSAYAQFGTGSLIPPSSVFDVPNVVGGVLVNPVTVLPKQTKAFTYQAGSVLKLRRLTLDGDFYYVLFGNGYTASPDPNAAGANEYQSSGNSTTKGFEGEANVSLTHGLLLYLNGTVGSARYTSQTILTGTTSGNKYYINPNNGNAVASTPGNTETWGLTYNAHNVDFGWFTKRIGPMWNDNKATVALKYTDGTTSAPTSITANQVIPVDAFTTSNLFMNYNVHQIPHFGASKLRLSLNNLFNAQGITGLTAANAGTTFTPAAGDTLTLLPGRSVTLSFQLGLTRRE
ncbi:TonB-dependent receptor [Terriglobus roseus]|uniref:Iron complex outermembrane recepter protein n=1 Tax=Terriglobus roseus TaxID=392734 RepID=A0A1H4RZR2_9BACT|nr:TonB-dependent receptor [Terriglobus roseus]SEC37277.1 iron complex outermembrane recepter protein [Terriglobus roseus]